jgi:hypothetical protein
MAIASLPDVLRTSGVVTFVISTRRDPSCGDRHAQVPPLPFDAGDLTISYDGTAAVANREQ